MVLNRIQSRRPHLSAKNNSSPKTRNDENRLALQPDFQAHGTRSGGRFACGYRDSARKGKRRGVLLVKCGRAFQTVAGLRPEMLWDKTKTRACNRDTSPTLGVMSVGKSCLSGRGKSDALG